MFESLAKDKITICNSSCVSGKIVMATLVTAAVQELSMQREIDNPFSICNMIFNTHFIHS